MVDVDDIHGVSSWYSSAMERLKEVEGYNQELILQFLSRLKKQGVTLNTRADRLNMLIRMDKYFKKPLNEISEKDFDIFMTHLDAEGYSQGYAGNYQKTYKKFCRLMMDNIPRWVADMRIVRTDNVVQPHELLTHEEITIMINTTSNVRNKALIAVLADSGMRIGAIGSLRIQNVKLEQRFGFLYISKTSKSHKTTGPKGIPITWSVGYLGQWLATHPERENGNAPLWVGAVSNPVSNTYEALSYNRILIILKKIAKDAGITKNIHPHIFRHKAITSWILDKLSEQEIKHRAGWSKGSSQMFKVYANFTDDEINKNILSHYGIGNEEKKVVLDTCPRCRATVPPDSRFCPQCSLILDHKAVTDVKQFEDKVSELIKILLETEEGRKVLKNL